MSITCELGKYYHEKHIGALDSEWPNANECCRNCLEKTNAQGLILTSPEEAYVGEKYENRIGSADGTLIPRLLFVSLDPGSSLGEEGQDNPEDRTMKNIRRFVVSNQINDRRGVNTRNRHWYQTHWIAAHVLAPFLGFDVDRDLEGAVDAVKFEFAHCRAARCSQNRENNRQVDDLLYSMCNNFLREEIQIISPDIIVSQGRGAANAIARAFDKAAPSLANCHDLLEKPDGKKMLWIPIYHPQARGRRGRLYFIDNQPQFKKFGNYYQLIQDFCR